MWPQILPQHLIQVPYTPIASKDVSFSWRIPSVMLEKGKRKRKNAKKSMSRRNDKRRGELVNEKRRRRVFGRWTRNKLSTHSDWALRIEPNVDIDISCFYLSITYGWAICPNCYHWPGLLQQMHLLLPIRFQLRSRYSRNSSRLIFMEPLYRVGTPPTSIGSNCLTLRNQFIRAKTLALSESPV